MKLYPAASANRLVAGLVLNLALLAPMRAQSRNEHAPSAPRSAPARAPEPRRPVAVDRVNHGTIRHADTHVVERPVEARHENEESRRGFVHRDVEGDLGHTHFWHGFVFGRHVGGLRTGYLRILFNGLPYFYDDGIYYQQAGDEYEEIYPPLGLGIPQLPDGAVVIGAGGLTYYYVGGAFYVPQGGAFVIAAPPMGVIVPELPPGAVSVSVAGLAAYQFNGIYYRPIFVSGVTQFQTFLP